MILEQKQYWVCKEAVTQHRPNLEIRLKQTSACCGLYKTRNVGMWDKVMWSLVTPKTHYSLM